MQKKTCEAKIRWKVIVKSDFYWAISPQMVMNGTFDDLNLQTSLEECPKIVISYEVTFRSLYLRQIWAVILKFPALSC